MPDGFLTTIELAAKYPVGEAPERAWYRLVGRWRDQGKLKAGEDWRYSREGGIRVRVYRELALLRLVWHAEEAFCEEVRTQHRAAILAAVKAVEQAAV